MIPNIRRGDSMADTMKYLVGIKRDADARALHVDPHLVAGSPTIMANYGNAVLTPEDGFAIADLLDESRDLRETYVPGGYVWHVPWAAAPEDGTLTDAQWSEMSLDFLRDMGFIDAEGKHDVPFAVVRHGLSGPAGDGQDHVHIAVSLVREDGTKADVWNDYARAQRASREVERKYGLRELAEGFGARAVTLGERTSAAARGLDEPERVTLSRYVRDAAARSTTEAEYVRRLREMRDLGVLVKPTMGKGGTYALGYAVGLVAPPGKKQVYYAGSKLANDLGLGVLRNSWRETSESKAEAHREWTLASFDVPVEFPDAEPLPASMTTFRITEAITELENLRLRMERTPHTEHEEWRRTAAHLSGLWASWSRVAEGPNGGPMRNVSDSLSRAAQVSRNMYRPLPPRPNPTPMMAEVMDAFQRGHRYGSMQVFSEMSRLTGAVRDYLRARRDVAKAEEVTRVAREELVVLSKELRELSVLFGGVEPEEQTVERAEELVRQREAERSVEQAETVTVKKAPERARTRRSPSLDPSRGRGLTM